MSTACALARDLFPAEPTIEPFQTDSAVHGHAAAPIPNQAMHALGYLDTRVLTHAMKGRIKAGRPDQKINVPWL